MYCPKCGTQNSDESKFCKNCGSSLIQVVPSPQPTREPPPSLIQQEYKTTRTSGLAVASLVMGLISIIISPLCILAIIFGGVAMSQTGKDPTLKGRGMAIAGLVLGIVVVVLYIFVLIFLMLVAREL